MKVVEIKRDIDLLLVHHRVARATKRCSACFGCETQASPKPSITTHRPVVRSKFKMELFAHIVLVHNNTSELPVGRLENFMNIIMAQYM